MNKPMIKQPGEGVIPNTPPDNFELDEIRWDKPEYQVHSGFIPFESTTKKILEELSNN